MDDARMTEIRNALTVNHEETLELLKSLRPEDLQRTAANGWTVGQLAGHVAVAPSSAIYVLDRIRKGRNATVPSFLSWAPALRNWFIVRKYRNATTEDMAATAESAYKEIFAYANGVNAAELDSAGEVFGSGRQTTAQFLAYVLEHGREHRAEIRAALDKVPVA